MKIATQPCASQESQDHYKDTIENKFKLDSIKTYLKPNEYQELEKLYPNNELLIWGVAPSLTKKGKISTSNETKWKKIEDGNTVVLFSKDNMFFSQALITKSLQNKKLAEFLWGIDNRNLTWEYIYFIDKISPISLDVKKFNKLVKYKPNNSIQGFNVLDAERSSNLYYEIDEFEIMDDELDTSKKAYEKVINKQFDDELDPKSQTTSRKEQAYLRKKLFERKSTLKCTMCHNEFPKQMLIAGHIKKRSKCTREERLDAQNIVMPICKFGCDDLFEKGYIRIDEKGKVYSSNISKVTPYVRAYIKRLVNNSCLNHNVHTEPYFKWHREFHESAKIK